MMRKGIGGFLNILGFLSISPPPSLRRFSAPAGTEQRADAPAGQVESDALQGGGGVEGLVDVQNFEHGRMIQPHFARFGNEERCKQMV